MHIIKRPLMVNSDSPKTISKFCPVRDFLIFMIHPVLVSGGLQSEGVTWCQLAVPYLVCLFLLFLILLIVTKMEKGWVLGYICTMNDSLLSVNCSTVFAVLIQWMHNVIGRYPSSARGRHHCTMGLLIRMMHCGKDKVTLSAEVCLRVTSCTELFFPVCR